MSPAQIKAVTMVVVKIAGTGKLWTLHHGDCVGADEDFGVIARAFGAVVETHPGPTPGMRAHGGADRTHPVEGNFKRNRRIVDVSAAMIATPFEPTHRDHGGTWYTVDYTLRQKKPLALVLPRSGGAVIEFSNWKWPDLPEEMTR
jgi:hypothetical protein